MKKLIASLLCVAMLCSFFSSCAAAPSETDKPASEPDSSVKAEQTATKEQNNAEQAVTSTEVKEPSTVMFTGVTDPDFLPYFENAVYKDINNSIDNSKYIVSSVQSSCISKEYLEELAYNSQSNSFFGYTLSELDEAFEGTKYVFTLGENGETTVQPMEIISSTDVTQLLKYAGYAVGAIIVITITVVVIKNGIPTKAIRMMFSIGGKTTTDVLKAGESACGILQGIINRIDLATVSNAIEVAQTLQEIITDAKQGDYNMGSIIGFISNAKELYEEIGQQIDNG